MADRSRNAHQKRSTRARQKSKRRRARKTARPIEHASAKAPLFNVIRERLIPHVAEGEIAALSQRRIRSLSKLAQVSESDLANLTAAYDASARTKVPPDALFALGRAGIAVDRASLAASDLAALRKAIESGAHRNIVPPETVTAFDAVAPVLARLQTHETSIKTLVTTYRLDIGGPLLRKLDATTIRTLADVRAAGGATALARRLGVHADDTGLAGLVAHAHLSMLGTDAATNALLIKHGYQRLSQVSAAPDGVFLAQVGGAIGTRRALRMKRVADAQQGVLQNTQADVLVGQANGFTLTWAPWIAQLSRPGRCGCEDCSSAVSPLAYLADLIGYATTKIGTLKAGLVPVYRLVNPAGDHFYTQSAAERDRAASGSYRYEGIAFYVHSGQDQGSTLYPLYRLYHPAYGDHFYTTDAGERSSAKTLGYTDEGTVGYIHSFTAGARDLLPVYRLLNDTTRDHFYTTDRVERDGAIAQFGYHVEGVERAGYVPAQPYDRLTPHGLEERFYQPFNDLPTACEQVNEQVRQVRICIEVLRAFADANKVALPASFRADEARYRRDTYQALLVKLGTSYAALRASRGASAEDRASLAASLGIPAGDGQQRDYLGELLLDIDTVTEADLERLFGLVDTTRDPLSHGAKRNDPRGNITRWNFSRVTWNVNTDPDGAVFLNVSAAGGTTSAEVYRAPGTTSTASREASGQVAANDTTVALASYYDSGRTNRLGGELEIDYVAAATGITFQVVPQFVSWRLQALRRQWQEQDWVVDAYSPDEDPQNRLPIVDPDVIGPDDFRDPFGTARTPFRKFWQARRTWIDRLIETLSAAVFTTTTPAVPRDDAFAALFLAMRQTGYGGTTRAFWPAAAADRLGELSKDLQELGDQETIDTATDDLWSAFRLTPEMLLRLLGLEKRHEDWVYDKQKNPSLGPEDWDEAINILAQAHKASWFATWVGEEEADDLLLGPADFWMSLSEPSEGFWPPDALGNGVPRIDPERLTTDDLPDETAGAGAIALWDARQTELKDFARHLTTFSRDMLGATNRIKAAFPGLDIADLEQRYEDLSSTTAATVNQAIRYVETTLRWAVEPFRRVMEMRRRLQAGQIPPPPKPTDPEWLEMERVLTSAFRQFDRWTVWRKEEDDDGYEYWNSIKARVPRWRASSEGRRGWQEALRARSAAALVDPDLLRETHLRPRRVNPAADLWRARVIKLTSINAGFQPASKTRTALETLLNDALGPFATDGSQDGLQTLLTDAREQSVTAARLEQLVITRPALDFVARMHGLLAQTPTQRLTQNEWNEIAAILTQVWKLRQTALWRNEEREAGCTLGPDLFKIPTIAITTKFPPPRPPDPPAWRGSRGDVLDWQDRLQSRIDQETTVVDAVHQAVSDVEELTLPSLRDALVMVCGRGTGLDDKADWLTERLFIDAKQGGCAKTTRVAQAIETLQQLLWGTRTGLSADAYPDFRLIPARMKEEFAIREFDDAWQWIGSYATWRAAMFVFMYPENILLPSLKRRQTPAFRRITEDFRGTPRLAASRFAASLSRFYDYFNDVCDLTLRQCQRALSHVYQENELGLDIGSSASARRVEYLFATTSRGALYWSVADDSDPEWGQTYWRKVEGFKNDLVGLAGCAVFNTSARHRYLYLFAKTTRDGQDQLHFLRLDLERGGWDSDATEIEIDNARGQKSFDVIVKPRSEADEASPPVLFLKYPDGKEYLYTLGQRGGTEESTTQPLGTTTDWSGRITTGLAARPAAERHIEFSPSVDPTYWHKYVAATSLCVGTVGGTRTLFTYWAQYEGFANQRSDYPYGLGFSLTRRFCVASPVSNATINWGTTAALDGAPLPNSGGNNIWPIGFAMADIDNDGNPELVWCYLKKISTDPANKIYSVYYTVSRNIRADGTPATLGTTELSAGISLSDPILGLTDNAPNSGTDLTWNGLKVSIATPPNTTRHFLVVAAASQQSPRQATLSVVEITTTGAIVGPVNTVGGPQSTVDGVPTGIGLAFAPLRNSNQLDAVVFYLMRPRAGGETIGEYFVGRDWNATNPQENWSEAHRVGENVDTWFGALTGGAAIAITPVNANDRQDLIVFHDGYGGGPGVDAFYRVGFDFGFDLVVAAGQCSHADFKPLSESVPLEFSNFAPLHLTVGDSLQRTRRNRNLVYLEEAFYFVPVLVASKLQQMQQFIAALDWFRLVYDYTVARQSRALIGLAAETSDTGFARDDPRVQGDEYDWLLDPLNPHSIARTRTGTYLRSTILSIVRCLLDYADAEFTTDTGESVPRARELYVTALGLLYENELKPVSETCEGVRGDLEIVFGDEWADYLPELVPPNLGTMNYARTLRDSLTKVYNRYHDSPRWLDRARLAVSELQLPATPQLRLGSLLDGTRAEGEDLEAAAMADKKFAAGLERVATRVSRDVEFTATLTLDTIPLEGRQPGLGLAEDPPAVANHGGWLRVSQAFCIPQNPILKGLRLRANLNLYKIRTCRNISGLTRELEIYAAPIDTVTGLPSIGAGGQLVLPGAVALRPTAYRYQTLIERAKQLVQLAMQIEQAFLSTLEKADNESYALLKAKQDLNLAKAGVRLQELRVNEAQRGTKLATLQRDRAAIQIDAFQQWMSAGLSGLEEAVVGLYIAAGITQATAGVAEAVLQGLAAPAGGAAAAVVTGAARVATAGLEASIRVAQVYASQERKMEEWALQIALATQDFAIGDEQIELAEDHVRVTEQERVISQMQNDNAKEVVDFLAGKFTSKELYDWMSGVLERVYGFFLQQATSVAQLAQSQLAFERQEAPPSFIQPDYWETQSDGGGGDGVSAAPDRRGLTGSARLLQDIYQLDQYSFDTNRRKLQLTKTLSLAQLAPFEFQRFRETGILNFTTPMEMFDRDFPGHYLRLIKRARLSVVALIPPSHGIRATLSSTGLSRVVVGGDLFQKINLRRDPETVAMSSPLNATGLFELEGQQPSEMLLPFEGTGVETQWEFRMLKSSNQFDFSTIADVLLTLEYTALNSFDYYQQLIQTAAMNRPFSADRAYAFRQEFADAWYDLHNPDQNSTPMVVRFRTRREDFPPNLSNIKIQHVLLYAASTAGNRVELADVELRFTENNASVGVGGAASTTQSVISTRSGNAGAWSPMIGKTPFGIWELRLRDTAAMRQLFEEPKPGARALGDHVDDLLLVITYSGRTPEWPM